MTDCRPLGSSIINWAYERDLIKFEVADLETALLSSGRLGVDRRVFESAQKRYLRSYSREQIVKAAQAMPSHWRTSERNRDLVPDEDMQEAFQAEFGHTMTDFSNSSPRSSTLGQS